ncbi:hypothetical protein OA101_00295 [Alphaproteobacteria bacterium]|nr:hypothetical protein [Alphaproteobacteria bacterium]
MSSTRSKSRYDSPSEDSNLDAEGVEESPKTLLRIADLGGRSRAIGLMLKVNDVVVAVDGEPFHGNGDNLKKRLSQPEPDSEFIDEEEPEIIEFLLTIYRKGNFFEVVSVGPLGGKLEFEFPDRVDTILEGLSGHTIYPRQDYQTYEVYKDIERKCVLIEQRDSAVPSVLPFVWLIENRMWEALLAIVSVYMLTFGIHPFVFLICYVLTCVYFKRGQLVFKRSYAQFQEKQPWIFLAARSSLEAQLKCRQMDEQCDFDFSQIAPPRRRRVVAA